MGHTPQESVGGVLISLSRLWACRWINHWSLWRMASATTDPQLPSQPQGITALDRYRIILLGDRGIAFSALTPLVGRHEGHRPVKKLSGGVLAWLSTWSKVQTCICPSWCHCHSLSLASVKSRLVLLFWYRPTRVVLDKGPLNRCVCVCVTFEHTLTQSECFLSTFIEHFKLFFLQSFRLCFSLQRLKCYGSVQCLQ